MGWLKKPEEAEKVETKQLKPTIKKLEEEKIKVIVVKELPVQRIRNTSDKEIIKQFTEEEVDQINFITIEEALTEMIE